MLRTAPRRPWVRAMLIVAAWALSVQSLQLSRFAVDAPATCCCSRHGADCQCPVCAHKRGLDSPSIRTCGSTPDSVTVVAVDPALPPVEVVRVVLSPAAVPDVAPALPATSFTEVARPPPRARA